MIHCKLLKYYTFFSNLSWLEYCSTAFSDGKYNKAAHCWSFVKRIQQKPVDSLLKGPLTNKASPCHDDHNDETTQFHNELNMPAYFPNILLYPTQYTHGTAVLCFVVVTFTFINFRLYCTMHIDYLRCQRTQKISYLRAEMAQCIWTEEKYSSMKCP